MNKLNFADQYKHPEWQKKRLEALNEAEFLCQRCFDKESQLHVHHKRYVKNRMLWEYSTNELEVLCECCHQEAHIEKDAFQEFIARFPSEAINEFFGLLAGYSSKVMGPAGAASVDDVVCSSTSTISIEIGMLAAILSNRATIGSITELHKLLVETPNGIPITFTIPIRKGFKYEGGGFK